MVFIVLKLYWNVKKITYIYIYTLPLKEWNICVVRKVSDNIKILGGIMILYSKFVKDDYWNNLREEYCILLVIITQMCHNARSTECKKLKFLYVEFITPGLYYLTTEHDISCSHGNILHRKPNQTSYRLTLIINQQMHYIKSHIKTLKIAPTCFGTKIILRELRCSLLKSF